MAYSIVTQHIAQADFTFRMTDMNEDGVPENYGFKIDKVKIYASATADGYRFRDTSLSKDEMMNKLAMDDHSDYCLVVALLYRDLG